MGSSRVTIADPGWRRPRLIEVAALSVSWRVNGAGRLSCRLPSSLAHRLPWDDLKGRWIEYQGGQLGRWQGIVEDDPGEVGGGTVELSCASMATLLERVTVPIAYRPVTSSPGGLIGRAITDAISDDPSWIRRFVIDEDGLPVTLEYRGEKLSRVIDSLTRQGGGLWFVEPDSDNVLTFTYRLEPIDRRGSVLCVEGVNVVAGSVRPTITTVVNDLTGVGNNRDFPNARAARVEDGDSIVAYGRIQETRRYPGHTRDSSIDFLARADLARLSEPTAAVSIQIRATNPILGNIRQGETIGLWSASTAATYALDVTGRAYQRETGLVTITGVATRADA